VLRLLPAEGQRMFTALLSNTASPNMLHAGSKVNVIPSHASAMIDCRLLPGQTPADAMREILAITGHHVTLEVEHTSTGASFPIDTPLYRLLEKATRKMAPEGVIAPMIMPGATDASEYQRAGIIMYGYTPGVLPADFSWIKLPHGHDERIPINAIRTGIPALWQVINEFC
jgi:acetylornithine deacetylase/succinyl-diaminopimelate desuccinylase-like protein